MASFSGNLHRPLSAAAAFAIAAVSSDLSDRFTSAKPGSLQEPAKIASCRAVKASDALVSPVCSSSIHLGSRASKSVDEGRICAPNSSILVGPSSISSCALLKVYQYAKLVGTPRSLDVALPSSSPEDVVYRWHLPKINTKEAPVRSHCSVAKSQTVVVLLGWLGARQKHLMKYADWYTSRGFHVITFTLPMADVVSYNVGGKAEQNVILLAKHLADCVSEQGENLIFHTFSNTGWLMYGVILENFRKRDLSLMEKVKGCIVDSAPVAAPDPQVWASGFSAALLKKQSVATQRTENIDQSSVYTLFEGDILKPKPATAEAALLAILEKVFEVVLAFPSINRRLTNILDTLSSKQPKCPQLYMYSSSDRVIPAKHVESFIKHQKKAGHEVKAYDFVSSPHVDHFRNHPSIYASLLSSFLDDHVLACCKGSG